MIFLLSCNSCFLTASADYRSLNARIPLGKWYFHWRETGLDKVKDGRTDKAVKVHEV